MFFFGNVQPTVLSFDRDSMWFATQLSAITLIAGVIFDRLPNEEVQRIVRDTRVYVLRIIGRNTSKSLAFFAALFLSAAAGISEEFLFRGVVLTSFQQVFGTSIAIFLSSALFGLAHFPVFGASAFVEAVLGGVFAFSYVYSDYNLAVPIAIHTLYDLFTIYYTWVQATDDMKVRVKEADEMIRSTTDKDLLTVPYMPLEIASTQLAVFKFLDANDDGFINKREFDQGLKMVGVSPVRPYTIPSPWQDELFVEMDKNGDGQISYEEFNAVTAKALQKWMSLQ